MKLFKKVKKQNGRRQIFFCGIKVFSYKKKPTYKKHNPIPTPPHRDSDLLVYTYANTPYYQFAIIYPIFILQSNPKANIEIAIENYDQFYEMYKNMIDFYTNNYGDCVYFHQVDQHIEVIPNSVRFVTQPKWYSKYVYIGDIDIIILHDIMTPHLQNINKNNLDFSNIKRIGLNQLTGLHFIEYNKMWPVVLPKNVTLQDLNDEVLLFLMMKEKGYYIPSEDLTYRPILGIHVSFYNRPPLPTLTTKDKITEEWPVWLQKDEFHYVKDYLDIRYNDTIKKFMSHIKPNQVKLRAIIQFIDMTCYYIQNTYLPNFQK